LQQPFEIGILELDISHTFEWCDREPIIQFSLRKLLHLVLSNETLHQNSYSEHDLAEVKHGHKLQQGKRDRRQWRCGVTEE
jgi:hypothetical protein